jgi:coatomer protein complex subunit epsilon
LSLQAQFEAAGGDEDKKQAIVQQMQSVLAESASPSVQLTASHVFLKAGLKKEALQCVHMGATLEHISMTLQLYLQIDRLDLAQGQLQALKRKDEDSILTQLGSVYLALATGSSLSKDAVHTLSQMSEQYGPSILLLNLMACALLQQGQYAAAEQKLEQARQEFGASNDADTIANLILAYQYQSKPTDELVQTLMQYHPTHYLAQGLIMVMGAFERESMKYRVAA